MSYRILTKNGIDNTNIDGARAEFFNSGMRDGIVKGAFNEGKFASNASNSICFDTCELRIAGHRVVINEPVYKTFSNKPSSDTRYSLVAQIIVDDASGVDFSMFVQSSSTALIRNNLFSSVAGSGTYQVEIGRFTLLTDGTVADTVRTTDVITGASENGDYIEIGSVSTTMLESGMDAEVDVENVTDENGKKKTNFSFALPKTAGSVINVNGEQVSTLNFISDPQTQIDEAVKKSQIVQETGGSTEKLMSQNAVTSELNEKLDIAQGSSNANKIVTTDADGNISPADYIYIGDIKIYKEMDTDGVASLVLEFPD